jgi:hypothetical protein
LIVTAIVYSATTVIYFGAREENNNLAVLEDFLFECPTPTVRSGDTAVVLRLDDVQAYGWTDVSVRMIEDTAAAGFPLTAAVIPKDLGTDPRITDTLRDYDCVVEMALHGFDNAYDVYTPDSRGEFAAISYEEAQQKLAAGREILTNYSNDPMDVFIPPHNQLSDGARAALSASGFSIISSEGERYFDYDTATFDFLNDTFVPAATVIRDCEERFARGDNLCVIMLHPQDFVRPDLSLDTERYAEYRKILEWLTAANLPVITMNEAARQNRDLSLFTRNLGPGMTDPAVAELQTLLNRLGFIVATTGPGAPGQENEYFDFRTQAAVQAFQKAEGIEPALGYLDTLTRDRLTERSLALRAGR